MFESMLENSKVVTEAEREAAEALIPIRLGENSSCIVGRSGNSPYSPETVVFLADASASMRGTRVGLAAVCRSHNGAENRNNPGRGRWRTVCVAAPKEYGAWAVCKASDRDAVQVGWADYYVRPSETHAAEQASRGLGLAQEAMAAAFESLGL